jgi:hypothetical protein
MNNLAKVLLIPSIGLVLALPATALCQPAPAAAGSAAATSEEAHAFDFEFGAWKAHLSRRLRPLTGSNEWVEYDGTSTVTPWWKGKANVGELLLQGPAGRIEGMSVRVYNPATHQWGISYASAGGGSMGTPMFGGFKNGRGEFYAQDTLNDRSIFVRFIFSGITAHSFQLEQAFSGDGGQSWEPNWIAKFTR